MKIELKNVKINLEFSQETTMFHCDLFVDDKKVAYCQNDGFGGNTYIQAYPSMDKILKDVEIYCNTLPPIKFESGDDNEHTLDMDIELYIDEMIDKIVEEKEQKKFQKKLEKDCLKSICYGNETTSYKTVYWKGFTIESLLRHPQGSGIIRKILSELILKGENILNKNIPQELYP